MYYSSWFIFKILINFFYYKENNIEAYVKKTALANMSQKQ